MNAEGEVRGVAASKVDKVVDTNWAGDMLTGFLASGVAGETKLGSVLKLAVTAAGLCGQRRGAAAAIPSRDVVRRKLRWKNCSFALSAATVGTAQAKARPQSLHETVVDTCNFLSGPVHTYLLIVAHRCSSTASAYLDIDWAGI